MPDEQLTLTERSVLLVLMAEAREMTNADLHAVAGLKLDGKYRQRLNDLDLVDSEKVGRAYVHALTDAGTLWCAEELSSERPARSGPAGGALYVILKGLRRHLEDTGHTLSEVFRLDVGSQVEAAYAEITGGNGESVRLAVLRDRLNGVPKDDVDRALELLARREDVHVRAESDQKTLTEQDHEAAVVLGGTPRHRLLIEVPR
ncbi:hypothetical protein JOF56_006572 [Kibdelosporangium banguiense]|uniref:MarR family transcriptional regulator n=1 Tax=Kibdelosporangium banguiense TaxID=1365924 RepID=A0ABS4TP53_9PSEU|nr:hypothetical protein [Kibdelosporangium banguiense]MBP2326187.1 hypothetical protein [Kibdelosporangium banguiense]